MQNVLVALVNRITWFCFSNQ